MLKQKNNIKERIKIIINFIIATTITIIILWIYRQNYKKEYLKDYNKVIKLINWKKVNNRYKWIIIQSIMQTKWYWVINNKTFFDMFFLLYINNNLLTNKDSIYAISKLWFDTYDLSFQHIIFEITKKIFWSTKEINYIAKKDESVPIIVNWSIVLFPYKEIYYKFDEFWKLQNWVIKEWEYKEIFWRYPYKYNICFVKLQDYKKNFDYLYKNNKKKLYVYLRKVYYSNCK